MESISLILMKEMVCVNYFSRINQMMQIFPFINLLYPYYLREQIPINTLL